MKKYILSLVALLVTLTASAGTAEGYYRGDINNDGNVDIQDVALLVNVLNNKATANIRCYLDTDKDVDIDDLNVLVDLVLHGKKEWVSLDVTIPGGTGDKPTILESKGSTLVER